MRSINWLNTAGYFFGVWVISMGGQWTIQSSGLALLFIFPTQSNQYESYVGGVYGMAIIYTIFMLSATGYSLYRHFSVKK
jgi:hypothetical protein